MKIAFVTSSLEPGRDGVGDYTTLLAQECVRRGHSVTRLALNDRHIDQTVYDDGLLRLPAGHDWSPRVAAARGALESFAPDVVSLQFVCYGFDPRGLAGRVAAHLRAILAGWRLQVFMHELWLGEECGASWKDRAIGYLQRRGVLGLLRDLAPRVVHTSNASYAQLLARRGVAARHLPLFGSLPLPEVSLRPPDDHLALVLFGTLHPVWPPEPLFSMLPNGRRIVLTHAGNIGSGVALWDRMVARYQRRFSFQRLGELPPQQIADVFAQSHFGIATTPWALIGKSASVAGMLDVGLPVIVNRDETRYPGLSSPPPEDPFLFRLDSELPQLLHERPCRPARLRLEEIASRFLADLTSS